MAKLDSTRLRYVSATEAGALSIFISELPYKVEIKGNPVFADGRFYLFFVLPEEPALNFNNTDL